VINWIGCRGVPVWLSAAFLLACVASPTRGDSGAHRVADFLSGPGNLLYLGTGLASPLLTDPHKGKQHSLRALDAVVTATVGSELLKQVTNESRPDDPKAHDGFPSGHATAAFALASSLSEYYPKQAPYWYIGAAAIGWSRVELRRHRTTDVLAGAALGYWVGKVEAHSRKGLLLGPVFSATGTGLGFTWHHAW
jgi:membrane-associated phospholipid phosphatase